MATPVKKAVRNIMDEEARADTAREQIQEYVARKEREATTLDPTEQDRLARMRNKPEYTNAFSEAYAEAAKKYNTGYPGQPAGGEEARRSASFTPGVGPDYAGLLEGESDPLDQTKWKGREEGHLGDARESAADLAKAEAAEAAWYQHARSVKQKQ